jgi:hypothetical protein
VARKRIALTMKLGVAVASPGAVGNNRFQANAEGRRGRTDRPNLRPGSDPVQSTAMSSAFAKLKQTAR